MKVTTDACLFGAWAGEVIRNEKIKIKNCLDAGTGTGLLALMYAQKNGLTEIDAIEIDKDAAEQAIENIQASVFKNRISVMNADAKEFLFKKKYDLIISNPPFYENELKGDNSKKNMAHHNEGLLLDDLLTVIKNNLADNGVFFLLLPYKRNEEIKNLFAENNLEIQKLVLVRQSVNHSYFRIMLMGIIKAGEHKETEFDELSIWNDKQEYTTAFTNLLKDYYLNL